MQTHLKVYRYHPEKDLKPYFAIYVLEVDPNDRVLDVLEQVRDRFDSTLAYRRSCAHAICGSCAMRINGQNRLACKVLIKDLNTTKITLKPLLGLKVIRDLVVDMDPFFENYRSVLPFLINDEDLPVDGKERLQSPVERERFDDTTKCILCAACTTACPPFWANQQYVGPAALVNAHRFVYDSRDRGALQRLERLNLHTGVWRCRTAFNCTEACPREIQITRAIAELKRALQSGSLE
jgi:succinate dehydrogenase / fumarate reductase iron-sulfur subunit